MEGDFDSEFEHWQVPDLKVYLQSRGITCHIYRKRDLIRLCQLAQELQLECLSNDSDYVDSYVSRRTVVEDGNSKVLCELGDIKDWSFDLQGLPGIEQCDILIYLLKTCDWTEERLKNYRQDSGYRLFSAGHIDDVCISPIPQTTSYKYVRASCLPETRQNADPYLVWILLSTTGTIASGGCSCVVDDGTCKHCVALLFALTNFSERHQDRHTLVGTDIECKWDKPRTKSEPMEVNKIDIRLDQSTEAPMKATTLTYKPMVALNEATQRDVEKKLYKLCKNTNAVLLQSLDPPSDDSDTGSESYPLTLDEIAESVKHSNDHAAMLQSKIKVTHDKDTINEIEKLTRGQSENPEWFSYRKGRITASNFSAILSYGFSDNSNNYILKRIMNEDPCFKTSAMKFGIENEPVARCLYSQQYAKNHMHANVRQCGLFIDETEPILGASPDGIVSCYCCGTGTLEIKCSAKFQDMDARVACTDDSYHLYMDENNKVSLKHSSPWFKQIQGQMGVCGMQWCDFVFYTKKDLVIERIYFDQNIYRDIVNKSKRFFNKYVINALMSKYT